MKDLTETYQRDNTHRGCNGANNGKLRLLNNISTSPKYIETFLKRNCDKKRSLSKSSIGKLHKLGHFVVVVQLIPGLILADISYTKTKKQA